ncbi:MAG: phosphoribosylformylglycinamidine synthase subunit PurL [Candidatus Levybacteria bacterium]|nr:phosphoribosylformylglycinamidine synthase subunit PurL [Candidatus Levybacteria bacterium]
MIQTIRVQTTKGPDLTGLGLLHDIQSQLHIDGVTKIRTAKVYRVEGLNDTDARILTEQAFCETINQDYAINSTLFTDAKHIVEIAYKPGVMNPEVQSILKSASDLGFSLAAADSSREYAFYGKVTREQVTQIIHKLNLFNAITEHVVLEEPKTLKITGKIGKVKTLPLRALSDSELTTLSKDTLFLTLEEMRVIQRYFQKIKRDPTDCELETLAQTWSEHCVHKTFRANLTIDGKKKRPLIKRIKDTAKGFDSFIVSAFEDNSGVIDFYDGYGICGKVETHNSPSAIEPYGGAMTGSGGVFRDVLGTGQGAKVLISTDVFCFAPPDLPKKDIPPGCLPPDYMLKKVVAGVRDYGNRVGIPTNNGSLHFHPDFRAKPTVAVGAYGILEKKKAQKGKVKPSDLILTLGGRTGRDGIHGATFSSGEMTDRTITVSGSAVQIGNAIEEKRVIDAVMELREKRYIRAITDCGAGGYSSAIGEMGKDTGAKVHLEKVPLKYTGLAPWEIFLSESQERMVIAVDPKHKKEVLDICKLYNVEATVIGEFTNTHRLHVFYGKETVCDLAMTFLHDGLPQRHMIGKTASNAASAASDAAAAKKIEKLPQPKDYESIWKKIMSHGNVCSKEPIVRLYDHTVQGSNALHPFGGVALDAPNDGAIVKPFLDKPYGLATTHGLNPVLNQIDPYWGSIWALTEAVANYVAIGGSLKDAALIDNFVWPFPDEASLADLDKAVDACTDMAKLLSMPFVSGKDSLSSTYRFKDKSVLKIPPVLLISVFGRIADVTKTMSSDFKQAGSTIVLVGKSDVKNLGGTTYFSIRNSQANSIPRVDIKTLPKTLAAVTKGIQAGNILAVHDISEGGIASALAEMCFGAGFGATVDVKKIAMTRPDFTLFNETAGTFLIEVANEKTAKKLFRNVPYAIIGTTKQSSTIEVFHGKKQLADARINTLKTAWQKPMKAYFS